MGLHLRGLFHGRLHRPHFGLGHGRETLQEVAEYEEAIISTIEEEMIAKKRFFNDHPELLPKNEIFLSHSGFQKPFVEQLCLDLQHSGYSPFFDQSPESLPKGEKYTELIFKAAEQCHLAVVVLSNEYLTSQWPMLELVAFVDAQKKPNSKMKILPLFYKLEAADLKDQSKLEKWKETWKQLVNKDGRFPSKECPEALRILHGTNGQVFSEHGTSEVEYREAIVASICKMCKPDLEFDVSAMEGRDRLCQIIAQELEKQSKHLGASDHHASHEQHSAATLGLYGMGGMGKTLLCKALCNHFHSQFVGRVCHVEFSSGQSDLEMQKVIMEKLTDASKYLLHDITSIEKADDHFKKHLKKRHVFLAVDNVNDNVSWLKALLKHMSSESKVVVTSRSLENVQSLLDEKKRSSCMVIPTIIEAEALNIFVRSAMPMRTSFNVEESCIMKKYINRCLFPVYISNSEENASENSEGRSYHPLTLEVLGSHLHGVDAYDPTKWPKVKDFGDHHMYGIFRILRSGFDALPCQEYKLLFLDVAVFAPRKKLKSYGDLRRWLKCIYDEDSEIVKSMLSTLQKQSLLEVQNKKKSSHITMHDLYKDFAEYEMKQDASKRWCVYGRNANLPFCLESRPPGQCWPDLVRVRLDSIRLDPDAFSVQKLSEWANLQVLHLDSLDLEHLNMEPLKCLRSLSVNSSKLKTLVGLDELKNLRFVDLVCQELCNGVDFTNCSRMKELHMESCKNTHQQPRLPAKSNEMKVFKFSYWSEDFLEVFNVVNLRSLREVQIIGSSNSKDVQWKFNMIGGESLTCLKRLILKFLPLTSIPGIENMIKLEHLNVSGCSKLLVLPDLGALVDLQELNVSRTNIQELRGVDKMFRLQRLNCGSCKDLQGLPDLRPLASLKVVNIADCEVLNDQNIYVSDFCKVIKRDYWKKATSTINGAHQFRRGLVQELHMFSRGSLETWKKAVRAIKVVSRLKSYSAGDTGIDDDR